MNILISNDDGIFAPGILAAKQAVEDIANVVVVAPDKNNSSVGRRLTLFKHLKINWKYRERVQLLQTWPVFWQMKAKGYCWWTVI